MTGRQIKALVCLILMVALAFGCMVGANAIQNGGGTINISTGTIPSDVGNLAYKLYTPVTATETAPAPAVLLLHGYQNDHETNAAYAIELARRGVVVLSIDEFGHGKTEPGLYERGWVNKKVSVNFGEESEAAGTFKSVSGPNRYKILMNFSNLSFFDDVYTKDDAGNSIKNSAEGGIEAYAWLASQKFVDPTRMGLSGHSMGTWASWSVAAAYAGAKNEKGQDISPKATVLQCGELFRKSAYDSENIYFNNVLLLQAKYDEFNYFRDYQNTVTDDLLKSDLRLEFLGTTADKSAWNTTFGNFADGSGRRIELLYTNHRLTTHNSHGLAVALDWFASSLGYTTTLASGNQIAMAKEWLNLAALFAILVAAMALVTILIDVPGLAAVKQPLPPVEHIQKGGKWWKTAIISILIAGVLYPFTTQLGHGLIPYPEGVMKMTVGDGLITWDLFIIIITLTMLLLQLRGARKKGRPDNWYERGFGSAGNPGRISGKLFGIGALIACIACCFVYLFVFIFEKMFALDLRMIWPMLTTFNVMRFGQFFVYLIVFLVYFMMVNSKAMANLRSESTYKPGFKGFMGTWWRSAIVMTGGVLLIVLIEYIPFFAGFGPGADLLFGSTFGGPFMSLMILLLPQILVYSLIGTYCYRKTGNIYIGGIISGILACWVVTGGSSFL